jgi:hypothetical protein
MSIDGDCLMARVVEIVSLLSIFRFSKQAVVSTMCTDVHDLELQRSTQTLFMTCRDTDRVLGIKLAKNASEAMTPVWRSQFQFVVRQPRGKNFVVINCLVSV